MKYYTIKENHLYHKTFRNGNSCVTGTMAVYVLRDKKANILKKENPRKEKYNRIGIQASKKVGGAVQRNRAKRIIREAYRKIDREYGIKKGYLIVICPRKKCTEIKLADAFSDLYGSLLKIGILAESGENDASASESVPRDDES